MIDTTGDIEKTKKKKVFRKKTKDELELPQGLAVF
jgi:hypothetical protein